MPGLVWTWVGRTPEQWVSPRYPGPLSSLNLPWRLSGPNPRSFASLKLFSPTSRRVALLPGSRHTRGLSVGALCLCLSVISLLVPLLPFSGPPMKAESETLPLGSCCLPWGPLLGRIRLLARHSLKSSPPPSWGGEPRGWGRGWTFGPFLLFPPSLRQQLPSALGSFLCLDLPGSRDPERGPGIETGRQT